MENDDSRRGGKTSLYFNDVNILLSLTLSYGMTSDDFVTQTDVKKAGGAEKRAVCIPACPNVAKTHLKAAVTVYHLALKKHVTTHNSPSSFT